MSTPAPSPPLPEWKPPRTSPLAGHRQVMPATVRVAPGGGVGVAAAAAAGGAGGTAGAATAGGETELAAGRFPAAAVDAGAAGADRKSTRLNSSHPSISYAVFCLKKKKKKKNNKAE